MLLCINKGDFMKKSLILFLLISMNAYATGGYENPAPISAQANSKSTAVESVINGAESLYLNPAGLAGGSNEVSVMLTTMGGYQQGSLVKSHEQAQSDASATFVPGVMAKYNISNKLGLGLGYYGVAGLGSIYHNIGFKGWDSELASYSVDNYSKLNLAEMSMGVGYQINKNFNVGLGVRSLFATGGFKQSSVGLASGLGGSGIPDDTVLTASTGEFSDLKGSKHGGYKLGLQYQSDSQDYGFGFVYRSKMDMHTKGKASGDIIYTSTGVAAIGTGTAGTIYNLTSSSGVTLDTSLPEQYSFAGNYKINPRTTVYGGYTLTKYSQNKELVMSGSLYNALTSETYQISNTKLYWGDLKEFKFGMDYKLTETMTVSGGTILSSGVTNPHYAGATYSPIKGTTQLGAGVEKKMTILNHNVKLNLAVNYIYGKGSGSSEEVIASNVKTPSVQTNTILRNYNMLVGVAVEF